MPPEPGMRLKLNKRIIFAYPGDISTLTGGYIYDAKIITGLRDIGLNITTLNLCEGFPYPTQEIHQKATQLLADVAHNSIVIMDGLALGVLPEAAKIISQQGQLIALVHHPLALETGTTEQNAKAFKVTETAALSYANHVIVTSPTTAKILYQDYHIAQNRLHIALPGIEPASFSNGSKSTITQLLSVAAISPRKGFDVLVAALGTLTSLKWHLTIAGDITRAPNTVATLVQQIHEAGLRDRITFLGSVSAQIVSQLYAKSDIFVLASRYEGYGMAYAEALAHGLPIIGTTGGAIPDVVPLDAGILVPPNATEPLAGALSLLIQNKAMRASFAKGAKKAAYALPRWSDTINIFKNILEHLK